ncbi:MAG: biotin/lipoyl-containing protein [Anaerolineales bacterium]|jgi:biotin carboxyl carrier protein
MRYSTRVDDREHQIEILDEHHVRLNERMHEIDFVSVSGQPIYSLIIDGKSFEAYVYPEEAGWQVLLVGRQYQVQVREEHETRLARTQTTGPDEEEEYPLRAPMPGLVVSIPVQEGQRVEPGQVLLVLESMKMQNELRSPRGGQVHGLAVKPGESVEPKQLLLRVV